MDNKVQLITYANRFGGDTLASLTRVLRTYFDGVYQGVHILPFSPPTMVLMPASIPLTIVRWIQGWALGPTSRS